MPNRQTTLRDRSRSELPYGLWRLENGREILFNRAYKPIWERAPNMPPQPANRNEWVEGARSAQVAYLYDDTCVPYRNPDTRQRCQKALEQFQAGQPVTPWR